MVCFEKEKGTSAKSFLKKVFYFFFFTFLTFWKLGFFKFFKLSLPLFSLPLFLSFSFLLIRGFGYVSTLLASYYSVANKPLWITEVFCYLSFLFFPSFLYFLSFLAKLKDGTSDTSVQGEFPSHLFDTLSGISYAPLCYWFCWSDGMVSPFGVVYSNGTKKESYYDFKGWADSHH